MYVALIRSGYISVCYSAHPGKVSTCDHTNCGFVVIKSYGFQAPGSMNLYIPLLHARWTAAIQCFICQSLYYVSLVIIIQVDVPSLQSRNLHSAAAFSLGPGLTEVTIFGGCPEFPSNRKSDADIPQMANTTVLRFGESTSCCVCPTLTIWKPCTKELEVCGIINTTVSSARIK